jgi:nudix-type nucleoside diphosphatase (YffH/AdpP family)
MTMKLRAILNVKTLYDGWNRFHRVTADIANAETNEVLTITHSVEDHGDGVGILPFDPAQKIVLLVRQVRLPVGFAHRESYLLESPAGGTGGESPEIAARRELEEEVGIINCTLMRLGAGYPMPGISTELTYLYLAEFDSSQTQAKGGGLAEEGEHIEIVRFPIQQLIPAIKASEIQCLRTIALTYALKDSRPELFA